MDTASMLIADSSLQQLVCLVEQSLGDMKLSSNLCKSMLVPRC